MAGVADGDLGPGQPGQLDAVPLGAAAAALAPPRPRDLAGGHTVVGPGSLTLRVHLPSVGVASRIEWGSHLPSAVASALGIADHSPVKGGSTNRELPAGHCQEGAWQKRGAAVGASSGVSSAAWAGAGPLGRRRPSRRPATTASTRP